jgi:paraquat-inducible protein B
MKRKGNATLIGAFVVAGLVLVIAAVIVAGGGKFFVRKERVVMHFSGSIYGLQVGAPVVFRGVRLGTVSSVGLVYDPTVDDFMIPVQADLEPDAIRNLGGLLETAGRNEDDPILPALVSRGLRAQLTMQSLLTGQLYVDLDLRPEKPGVLRSPNVSQRAMEIPTTSTAIQNLKNQIDGMDLRRLMDDVSAIASSARAVVAGPQLKATLDNVMAITADLRRLADQLQGRIGPLADSAGATLNDARRAADKVSSAADGVKSSAARIGATADSAGRLLAPDSKLVLSIERAAEQLGQAATALAQQAGESGVVDEAGQAMQDVSRAARSVRELAETLKRQPDALLRGRRGNEAGAAVPPAQALPPAPGPAPAPAPPTEAPR